MKLVDILARELAEWPDALGHAVGQAADGALHCEMEPVGAETVWTSETYTLCKHYISDIVTRAEWQAAVDALNAPKVVEWDGVGSPEPGCSIEYSIGDGWYPCEVRYALNRDDCPGIALVAWCEHLGKDQYLSNDRGHKFRPARSAEQVDAEEREKGIQEICTTLGWRNIRSDGSAQEAAALYDAGYRKEPKPCGS